MAFHVTRKILFLLDYHSSLLFRNANISKLENEEYEYNPSKQYPCGFAKFDVLLDEVTYHRYCSTFNIQIEKESKKKGKIRIHMNIFLNRMIDKYFNFHKYFLIFRYAS